MPKKARCEKDRQTIIQLTYYQTDRAGCREINKEREKEERKNERKKERKKGRQTDRQTDRMKERDMYEFFFYLHRSKLLLLF